MPPPLAKPNKNTGNKDKKNNEEPQKCSSPVFCKGK